MEHVTPESLGAEPAVSVRYWAGAAAAAGCEHEKLLPQDTGTDVDGSAVRAAILVAHPAMKPVLARCALLVDGVRLGDDDPVPRGHDVEVLPPFVGG